MAQPLRGRPHVSFELAWSGAGMRFGMWLPASVPAARVEHAIQAAWSGAVTRTDPASAPLPLEGTVLSGEMRLSDKEWFPLHTDHEADPYRMILGAGAGLGSDDVAVVQILARPARGRRLAGCHQAARTLRSGPRMGIVGSIVNGLLDLIQPGPPATQTPRPSDDPWRVADVRAIQTKAAEVGWEVAVRYGVAGSGRGWRERRRLGSQAREFSSTFGLYDGRNRLVPRRRRRPASLLASRSMRRGELMSVSELVALAHLPLHVGVPGVVRAGARAVVPPIGVPSVGKVLGDAETGPRRAVALHPADARHHLHVLGATGCGKSTLLTNLVLGDVAAGRGAVVIDPKGDLVNDILDRLPASAAGRVVLLDPEEAEAPPALNALEGPDPALAVEHTVGIFRRIFETYWGPRTDDVLRVACLTVLASPGVTLADVPRLLTTGECTVEALAAELAHRGLRNRGRRDYPSKPFSVSGVAALLSNKVYVGIVEWGGVEYPGQHPPLVDAATFNKVQDQLASRAARGVRECRHNHHLKGTLVCGVCGRGLSCQFSKGRYLYFYCLGQKSRRYPTGCRESYVAADRLEDEVAALYRRVQLPEGWLKRSEAELEAEIIARQARNAGEREFLTRKLARLEGERRKLLDAYYAGAIDVGMLKAEQDRLGKEVRGTQDRLGGSMPAWRSGRKCSGLPCALPPTARTPTPGRARRPGGCSTRRCLRRCSCGAVGWPKRSSRSPLTLSSARPSSNAQLLWRRSDSNRRPPACKA